MPDVPDMWARDAVAALCARGLLEGYADGTFKGDRAATRYEVAVTVARLLALMEQQHISFASRADMDAVRALVAELRAELEELGVRVHRLDEELDKLDARVAARERITFYGSLDARFVSQTMSNQGLSNGINGSNLPAALQAGGGVNAAKALGQSFVTAVGIPAAFSAPAAGGSGRPTIVNQFPFNSSSFNTDNNVVGVHPSYNLVVGSNRSVGGNVLTAPTGPATGGNPFTRTTGFVGVTYPVPVVIQSSELRSGRPITAGTGWSDQAVLGVVMHPSDDFDGGVEFAAYQSTGDPVVDAFFGVAPHHVANAFASNQDLALFGADGGQGDAHTPFTRMDLDNFWLLHKSSHVRLQVGAFNDPMMDPLVYVPEFDPNVWGAHYLDNYGVRVSGRHANLDWEVFGSNVADGNRLLQNFPAAAAMGAAEYKPYLWGADVRWSFGGDQSPGRVQLNALRIWDSNSSGSATTVGSIVGVNGVWVDWANPAGFYVAQLGAGQVAGLGSTSDVRPITPNIAGKTKGGDQTGSGFFGTNTEPALLFNGLPVNAALPTSSFGPQSMFTWGATANWEHALGNVLKFRVLAEFGDSSYKPSMNSPYTAPAGLAYRLGGGLTMFDDYALDAEYLRVNPFYSPFILQFPQIDGVTYTYGRIPSLAWAPSLYPVSDKEVYPNNREGFRATFKWNPIDPQDGRRHPVAFVEYGNMAQERTTLQGVRYSPGSVLLGPTAAPNGFVLGQLPGFIDVAFPGFTATSFAGFTGSTTPSAVNQFAYPLENPKGHVENWGLGFDYRFESLGGLRLQASYKDFRFTRGSSLPPALGGSENNVRLHFPGGIASAQYPINDRLSLKAGFIWNTVKGHLDAVGTFRNYALDTNSTNFDTLNERQSIPFVGCDLDVARNVSWNTSVKWYSTRDRLGTFNTPNFFMQRNPFSWSALQVASQMKVSF